MNSFSVQILAPALAASTERTKKLLEAVASQLTIDRATGRATIKSKEAIVEAFVEIKGPDAERDAQYFLSLLNDGFAIPKTGVDVDDPSFFQIPWGALSHAPTLDSLTIENWKWLGIEPWSDVQEIRKKLAERFISAPDYMFEASRLSALRESAASIRYVDSLNLPVYRPPNMPGEDAPTGGSPTIDYLKLLNAVYKCAQDVASCLLHGAWSIENLTFRGVPLYSLGPRVCLDLDCANKVENALKELLGIAGTDVASLIVALISRGLLTLATLCSWSTWVGAAMIFFAGYWASSIETNKTQYGVCIVHLWPYNSLFTMGLVNGWAEGR